MDADLVKPPRPRLSIRGMMILTAAMASAFGALLFANEWWLVVLTTLLTLGTIASIVLALLDDGHRRAFGVGFLACVITHVYVQPDQLGIGNRSPAARMLERLYPLIFEPAPADPRNTALMRQWVDSRWRYHQQYFLPVGDQLWLLLLSGGSGWFAQVEWAARTRRETQAAAI